MDVDSDSEPTSYRTEDPNNWSQPAHSKTPKDAKEDTIPVDVEVCVHEQSTLSANVIRSHVAKYINDELLFLVPGKVEISSNHAKLAGHIQFLRICHAIDISSEYPEGIPQWKCHFRLHVYRLDRDGASDEMTEGDENTVACSQWMLPALDFEGLWDSLYFDTAIKNRLLNYASTAVLFSDKSVDPNIISCNRVVLLHGPPGTGKTSLCKALAQKLSIRFGDRYQNSQLLEINAHSLFSKWFSESGKLVMKLFERIQDLIDDKDSLIFVLIDEVESLTSARQSALSGSEPSDAIRVVNALLTQIDKLKFHENVMVLTTSNITEAIDVAFVDRADIKLLIDLPNVHARYEILRSCINELTRVGLVEAKQNLPPFNKSQHDQALAVRATSLHTIAERCQGLSGRFLRKLPFQAHSLNFQSTPYPLQRFLDVMNHAVDVELKARSQF